MRELAERTLGDGSGRSVVLLHNPDLDACIVAIFRGQEFLTEIPVEPEKALDAFHHPYAYGMAVIA